MIDLRLGDCLDLLPTLAPQSIDAVIADIPYGTTACKWDTVIPLEPMWEQLKRIAKPKAAIVLFGSQPFTSALVMSNPKWFRYEWIWEKALGANPLLCKKQPMKYHENILVFSANGHTYNPQMTFGSLRDKKPSMSGVKGDDNWGGMMRSISPIENVNDKYYPRSVCYFSNAGQSDKVHPTQKPIALMEYLVKTYTNAGDTVLDFTMGSGTTGVACVKTNRNFIGFELDAGHFESAQKRIAEAQQQMVLL